jgi:hypothetical protein
MNAESVANREAIAFGWLGKRRLRRGENFVITGQNNAQTGNVFAEGANGLVMSNANEAFRGHNNSLVNKSVAFAQAESYEYSKGRFDRQLLYVVLDDERSFVWQRINA